MVNAAIAIILCAAYTAACVCFGGLLIRALAWRSVRRPEVPASMRLATAVAMGQGVLACVWQMVGVFGVFHFWLAAGLLAGLAIAGAVFTYRLSDGLAGEIRAAIRRIIELSWPWKILVCLLGIQLVFLFVSVFSPPRGDSAMTYMVMARMMAAIGRLIPMPGYEVFMQAGQQGEMHYAALMLLGSDMAAKLLAWPNVLADCVLLAGLAGAAGLGGRAKLLAVVMLLTSTAFTFIAVDGKVDAFSIGMAFCAFYWAFKAGFADGSGSLRLAGLLAGLAVISKLTYVGSVAPCALAIAIFGVFFGDDQPTGGRIRKAAWTVAVFGFWFALACLPQVVKNAVLFAAPLAPVVVGPEWQQVHVAMPNLSLTWQLVLKWPIFPFFGRIGQYGNISMLVLAFLPLVLLLPRRRPALGSGLFRLTLASLIGLAAYGVGFFYMYQTRHFMPTILLLILPAAAGAERICLAESRPRILSAGVLAVSMISLLAILAYEAPEAARSARYAAGLTSHQALAGPSCRMAEAVNAAARPGERVFIAHEFRYWLRGDLLATSPGMKEAKILAQLPDDGRRWEKLYEMGVRFVMFDDKMRPSGRSGLAIVRVANDFFLPDRSLDMAKKPDWMRFVPIFSEAGHFAYRIEAAGEAATRGDK
ncbi:MAG: hypothetical protein HZA50_07505 [Planctomycetes bacterium]|nr:hypothetical protein [Planctomycetota bacterium]